MQINGIDVLVGTQVQSLVFDYETSVARGGICRGDIGNVVRVEPERVEVVFYPWGVPTMSWWTKSETAHLTTLVHMQTVLWLTLGRR